MTAVQQRPRWLWVAQRTGALRHVHTRVAGVTNASIASSKRLAMSGEKGSSGRAGADMAARQALMRVCADATEADFEAAIAALGGTPPYEELRPPQTGLVMLRGRAGGSGPAFNAGEATLTRAVVRLESGAVGYSYLLGRSHQRARLAA